MLKPIIAATAVLALAGSSLVYAQQREGGHDAYGNGSPRIEHRHHWTADDIAAFTDARIAALKAGLELTPDQAKNWPAFEQALRDMVQLRVQRMQARQAANQPAPATPFDRMARRADNMSKTSAALKRIADTGAPLYQSLNDAQKSRFTMLARVLRPHHHQHASNGREGGWWRSHRFGRNWEHGGSQFGQYGHGWWHNHRFGQNDRGPGGRPQNLTNGDGSRDSQL